MDGGDAGQGGSGGSTGRGLGEVAAIVAASALLGAVLALGGLFLINDGSLEYAPRHGAGSDPVQERVAAIETALAVDGASLGPQPTQQARPTMTLRISARGIPTPTSTPIVPTSTAEPSATATASRTPTATRTASVTPSPSASPAPTRTAAPLRTPVATATLRILP